jgi:putative endonuclease
LLENPVGRFYVGSTDDLDRRVQEHNDPSRSKDKYTAKHGPWRLVWFEPHRTRADAMAREKQIKAMKSARWIRESRRAGTQSVERVPARRD